MANRRTNRKNRKASRKNRKASRKNRCGMWGGDPASVTDSSMLMPMKDSLAQGDQFADIHRAQHGGYYADIATPSVANTLAQMGRSNVAVPNLTQAGGYAPYPGGVTGSVLSGSLIPAARTGPLDVAISQIQGMQDGGRRRHRKSRRGRKASRKNRSNRRRRNHRGGSLAIGSPIAESSMLLPPGLERQASLNYEWSLAKDPSSFAPKQ